jgi:hypothetical protein
MAKVTLSFEIENVNEGDIDEIEGNIEELLHFGAEQLGCKINNINFIEFETSPEENEEELNEN